jgi:Leucine-rich repeat (LRR) protein
MVENILISDTNPFVRDAAAQVITHHYIKEGLNSLKYAITHDKSPLVMKTIFEFLKDFKVQPLELLNGELNRWIEKFTLEIGVVQEEAKFFLDLEALFANENEAYEIDTSVYEYFKVLTDFKSGEPWLSLKEEHVEILNFNYFNWKFLKENQDNIEPIMKLNSPDLFLRSIKKLNPNFNNSLKIPNSIGLLKYLKILNLNQNNIASIPDSIGSLSSIEKLDLSHNNLHEISESICALTSLKILNLSYNNIQKVPSSITNLELLSELKIHKNKIKIIPESLNQFFGSLAVFRY